MSCHNPRRRTDGATFTLTIVVLMITSMIFISISLPLGLSISSSVTSYNNTITIIEEKEEDVIFEGNVETKDDSTLPGVEIVEKGYDYFNGSNYTGTLVITATKDCTVLLYVKVSNTTSMRLTLDMGTSDEITYNYGDKNHEGYIPDIGKGTKLVEKNNALIIELNEGDKFQFKATSSDSVQLSIVVS